MSEPRNPESTWDRTVAVAVDGSDYAQAAADWAAGEALRLGTPLRVLTVVADEIDEDSLELLSDTETWLTKIYPGLFVQRDVHECTQVLRYALDHAESAGGGLRAVHAWAPYPAHSSMYVSDRDITARHAEERIAKWFEAARAEHHHVRPEITVLRGRPAELLIEQSRDADLIVAGSHRSLLPRRGVGPVLHELLMRARCPVAVVPVH